MVDPLTLGRTRPPVSIRVEARGRRIHFVYSARERG